MAQAEILVTGAGGCIRGHLVDALRRSRLGAMRAVDIKPPESWYRRFADVVEKIAGIRLRRSYMLDAPTGVNGRSSDNSMILQRLGWQPSIPLADGSNTTYAWIHDQYLAREKRLPRQV